MNETEPPTSLPTVTEPFVRFLQDCYDILDFAGMVWGTAAAFDILAMEKSLPPIPEVSEVNEDTFIAALMNHATQLSDYMMSGKLAWQRLDEHRQLQFQMLYSRIVDNFLTYLSELIEAVYQKQPNLLKTQEMVTTEYVLDYGTMEEFIAALSRKRVHDLAYKGIRELAKTLSKAWGVELFPDENALSFVIYMVEIRNVIVHNRALASQVFVNRTQGLNLPGISPPGIGERFTFDAAPVLDTLKVLVVQATRIDRTVAAKFALATQIAPEPKQPFNFPHREMKDNEGDLTT